MGFVEVSELSVLLRLVLAHLLADFALQKTRWVEERSRRGWASVWLYAHSGVAALLAYMFAGLWTIFWLPLAVFASHLALDRWKTEQGDTARMFVLDQGGHLVVLLILWAVAIGLPWGQVARWASEFVAQPALWVYVLAYAAVFWPAGIFVAKFSSAGRENSKGEGLGKTGLWIGRLERVLALTALFLGRFEVVGLLLVAKALFALRGRGRADSLDRGTYLLLGTLMSFVVAVVVGGVAAAVLAGLPALQV
ncbi:MAG: DUF3307 domain-containing protein [Candidatus Bipolaricaulota bacterium]